MLGSIMVFGEADETSTRPAQRKLRQSNLSSALVCLPRIQEDFDRCLLQEESTGSKWHTPAGHLCSNVYATLHRSCQTGNKQNRHTRNLIPSLQGRAGCFSKLAKSHRSTPRVQKGRTRP